MRARTSLALALLLGGAVSCSGSDGQSLAPGSAVARWHVALDGPPDGDGTSWARAARELAAVLAKARPHDEVWVASGHHRPAPAGGSRDAAFALVSHVRLYGGFAGGETALSERDPAAHPTILDGDLNGDDGPHFAQRADNAYQVVVGVDVHGALLDGFTIRGGYADGPSLGPTPASRDQGAGVNLYHGSITVRRCVLRDNWAVNHGAVNDHSEGSVFQDCTFEGNASAQFGAGLYLHHEAATLAIDCTFRGNVATTEGGGMYVRALRGARVEGCLFEANAAERGAGLYAAPASGAHVARSEFRANRAELGGGGSYSDEAFTTFEECLFEANEAGIDLTGGGGGGGGSGGGGAWTNGGAISALRCLFRANRASFGGGFYAIHDARALVAECGFEGNQTEEGGGLYSLNSPVQVLESHFRGNSASGGVFSVGGGMSHYFSDCWVEGCLFHGNVADLGGGGAYLEGEAPTLRACTFVGNSALGPLGFGGGVMTAYFARALLEDCAFVGNEARAGGGTFDLAFSEARIVNCTYVRNRAQAGGAIHLSTLATPRFTNCIVVASGPAPLGGAPADFRHGLCDVPQAGGGNLLGLPLFARAPDPGADGAWGTDDDDAGDLRLVPGSPGIDAGDNAPRAPGAGTDLAGHPRFVDDPQVLDTGLGRGPLVDLGAFERQPGAAPSRPPR